jgi:hypothetical protein
VDEVNKLVKDIHKALFNSPNVSIQASKEEAIDKKKADLLLRKATKKK